MFLLAVVLVVIAVVVVVVVVVVTECFIRCNLNLPTTICNLKDETC